jgi:hypothetical protein
LEPCEPGEEEDEKPWEIKKIQLSKNDFPPDVEIDKTIQAKKLMSSLGAIYGMNNH